MTKRADLSNPHAIAEALVAIANELKVPDRNRGIVSSFERLHAVVPSRPLLTAVSGRVEQTPAIKLATEWATKRRTGILVFAGPLGTGKTLAAAWYACRRGHGCTWLAAPKLGLATHARAHSMIDELTAAPALVLDELGGQGTTGPHAVDRLAALLSDRHAQMRPTVITTNLNRRDLAMTYDGVDDPNRSRLLDRVDEDGAFHIVAGSSRRSEPVALLEGRVDLARSFLERFAIVEDIANGAPPNGQVLHKVQAELEVTDAMLEQRIGMIEDGRARFADLAAKATKRFGGLE